MLRWPLQAAHRSLRRAAATRGRSWARVARTRQRARGSSVLGGPSSSAMSRASSYRRDDLAGTGAPPAGRRWPPRGLNGGLTPGSCRRPTLGLTERLTPGSPPQAAESARECMAHPPTWSGARLGAQGRPNAWPTPDPRSPAGWGPGNARAQCVANPDPTRLEGFGAWL